MRRINVEGMVMAGQSSHHQSGVYLIAVPACLLAIGLIVSSCRAEQKPPDRQIPLVPLAYVAQGGGVVPWRAPLHVRDTQLQLAEYGPAGEREMRLYDDVVFPTDVLVVKSEADQEVSVYLRRSPHGGCLLLWDAERSLIHDPCFGSKFDPKGEYVSGPARRNLDQLPASIREEVVWVGSEVIYGEPHP